MKQSRSSAAYDRPHLSNPEMFQAMPAGRAAVDGPSARAEHLAGRSPPRQGGATNVLGHGPVRLGQDPPHPVPALETEES